MIEASILRHFGANVKRLRRLKKITQETLAQSCGLYRSYLSRIEKGVANPTLNSIIALAEALGVEPGHLLLSSPLPLIRFAQPEVPR